MKDTLVNIYGLKNYTMQKKAFTMVELLVSITILSLVMLSITNIFLSGRKSLLHSRERLTAANFGRMFVDPLQYEVRQDAIDFGLPNCLYSGGTLNCPTTATIDPLLNRVTFTPTYTITPVTGYPLYRVKVRINWTDLS
jgi:prepilin-type N-terminal cleavage/methylation domain-containing protein